MDTPLDPAEFAEALWRFRLRGLAAADGLAALAWSKAAREAWDRRLAAPDPQATPMRGFLCEAEDGAW